MNKYFISLSLLMFAFGVNAMQEGGNVPPKNDCAQRAALNFEYLGNFMGHGNCFNRWLKGKTCHQATVDGAKVGLTLNEQIALVKTLQDGNCDLAWKNLLPDLEALRRVAEMKKS